MKKVRLEFEITKSLSFGGEIVWDKRFLKQKDMLIIGLGFLCFTLFIVIEK